MPANSVILDRRKIRALLAEKGWNQTDVGKRMGISQSAVSHYISYGRVKRATLERIAAALNVAPEEIEKG